MCMKILLVEDNLSIIKGLDYTFTTDDKLVRGDSLLLEN